MTTYEFYVAQKFYCNYLVQANSEEEAWDELMNGQGDCTEQNPDEILDDLETAYVLAVSEK